MTKDQSREIVYGMPYDEWKAKHQKEASADQKKAFDKAGCAQALTLHGHLRRHASVASEPGIQMYAVDL